MLNRASAIQKESIIRHEKTEKLKILDVYWTSEVFGSDSRLKIFPIGIKKKLIIETDIPSREHEKKVNIQFFLKDSIQGNEPIKVAIDSFKDKIELPSGEKRYRFEMKEITHDLIQL